MKAALLQLTSSDDPVANLQTTRNMVAQAAGAGAGLILTPEVTNCVSLDRRHQQRVLQREADDITLLGLSEAAAKFGVWISIGSLALLTEDPDGRFANRSFLIAPNGEVVARYDKIHMFDVNVTEAETFCESEGFRPGKEAVLAETEIGKIGLTICYDLRFPHLHRTLARHGAQILLVPAAFSPVTGRAHWEPLLRARAIETGCYVLASAQTGTHSAQSGASRSTHGHSLAVSPWGEVLADAGEETGVTLVDLDLSEVAKARKRIPALSHDRDFAGP